MSLDSPPDLSVITVNAGLKITTLPLRDLLFLDSHCSIIVFNHTIYGEQKPTWVTAMRETLAAGFLTGFAKLALTRNYFILSVKTGYAHQ